MQDTEGFARHRLRSTPHGGQLCRGISGSFGLESVAALAWNQRQLCYGISGSIRVEQVAALPWNWWQDSPGIGGSFGVEYAVKEPEQVSNQPRGIREKRLCPVSRSMTQRLGIFQGRIFRLIPCVSSEAAGSPTLLP